MQARSLGDQGDAHGAVLRNAQGADGTIRILLQRSILLHAGGASVGSRLHGQSGEDGLGEQAKVRLVTANVPLGGASATCRWLKRLRRVWIVYSASGGVGRLLLGRGRRRSRRSRRGRRRRGDVSSRRGQGRHGRYRCQVTARVMDTASTREDGISRGKFMLIVEPRCLTGRRHQRMGKPTAVKSRGGEQRREPPYR